MFGRKDSIKEFEQMRQALKPAERYAQKSEIDNAPSVESQEPVKNPTSDQATQLPAFGADLGEHSSVVSFGSSWQGNIKIEGSMRIDGEVAGEIDARETVFVAESAKVNAKIRAAKVVIAGEIEGEVNCTDRLEIMPTGRVRAELTTRSLTVFEGAFIEGQIHMTRPEPVATPAATRDVGLKLAPEKPPKVVLPSIAEHV